MIAQALIISQRARGTATRSLTKIIFNVDVWQETRYVPWAGKPVHMSSLTL